MAEETTTKTTESTETTTESKTETTVDYEALYNQEVAKSKKMKNQIDEYSSQIATYKNEKKAQMTEEEQKAEAERAKDEKLNNVLAELAQIKAEKVFADSGFTSEEYSPIIENMKTFGEVTAENCQELSRTILNLINSKVETAKETIKNSATQKNTYHPNGEGSATPSDFKKYQDEKFAHMNTGEVKF